MLSSSGSSLTEREDAMSLKIPANPLCTMRIDCSCSSGTQHVQQYKNGAFTVTFTCIRAKLQSLSTSGLATSTLKFCLKFCCFSPVCCVSVCCCISEIVLCSERHDCVLEKIVVFWKRLCSEKDCCVLKKFCVLKKIVVFWKTFLCSEKDCFVLEEKLSCVLPLWATVVNATPGLKS